MIHDFHSFRHLIVVSTSFEPIHRPEITQVRGHLTLVDQSVLYVRENYIVATGWIDYSYHWQTATHQFIHRWDNAHPVDLSSSPFHQHIGSEENIQPSEPMTLEKVLAFIDRHVAESPVISD